jgi:sulfur-carrier protein
LRLEEPHWLPLPVELGINNFMTENGSANSMQITVKVFGGLRESFRGGTQLQRLPSPSTLALLLQQLGIDFPDLSAKLEKGLSAGYLNILINGRNIQFLEGRETGLHEGDTVAFLPPVGGG